MIPFNLLITRNPRPTVRKPNPLRASGPYYHICYVRCAISNLRPPNCFYNTSPVHPRFLFSLLLFFLWHFLHPLNAHPTSNTDVSPSPSNPFLDSTRVESYVCRDDKFHSTNRARCFATLPLTPRRIIINSPPCTRRPSYLVSRLQTVSAKREDNDESKVTAKRQARVSYASLVPRIDTCNRI